MEAIFKVPPGWRPSLADRTALYPALHLREAGHKATIAADPSPEAWRAAQLRVLVADGKLGDDDRALIELQEKRPLPFLILTQARLPVADRALMVAHGGVFLGWEDPGPLASPGALRTGERRLRMGGLAARAAEDLMLAAELDFPAAVDAEWPARRIFAVAEDAASLEAVWPALQPAMAAGARVFVAFERGGQPAPRGASAVGVDDPRLRSLICGAESVLCVFPNAVPDDPRPGQWARTALFAGAPVIAASHPSLDGLAHLCVLDDFERGLQLYSLFPAERLKAAAIAQAELSPRLEPQVVAREWVSLAAALARAKPRPPGARTLLALIDIHQDLDVLLPVLLALKARGEVKLQLVLSEYLLAESPRIAAALAKHGLEFVAHPREAMREGSAPPLAGVHGVLSGADTNTRAHKAGHTLAGRARALGLPSFTLQHGLENIGLTYKDHLHGEEIRFASDTVFTWGAPEGLASWVPAETRAKVVPVGSPKAPPAPAAAPPLRLGQWERTIGVFENLHWHRFSDLYLERCLEDLAAAALARPDTLFLIKPHHAGRWLSRRPERLKPFPNLLVIDPTDSAWEPHTAPALMAKVERVLTTPSTVALDAARTGRPVAVLGYDLELPLYQPLPIVRRLEDLDGFLDAPLAEALLRNEAFVERTILPGRADHRIAAHIAEALEKPGLITRWRRRLLGR